MCCLRTRCEAATPLVEKTHRNRKRRIAANLRCPLHDEGMTTRLNARSSIAVLGISVALLATACEAAILPRRRSLPSARRRVRRRRQRPRPTLRTRCSSTRRACVTTASTWRTRPSTPTAIQPGGGFGAGSGIDPRSDAFQTAKTACGDLLQGVSLGGGNRTRLQRIQNSLSDYTACLARSGTAGRRHHLRWSWW